MTNEALAELIQRGGNDELVPLLWENTYKVIFYKIEQYWAIFGEAFHRFGFSIDDIKQEGYNALLFAVKQYDSGKPYQFTTYLNYAIKNTLRGLLKGKSDALNQINTMSLEQPISEDTDGGDLLLSDIVPDERAAQGYDRIDSLDEFKPLHEAVDSLPEKERRIIQMHYFEGLSLQKCGERVGVSSERARQIEQNALKLLRTGQTGKLLRDLYGGEYAPRPKYTPAGYSRHKGLAAFRTSGSSEVEDYVLRRLALRGF